MQGVYFAPFRTRVATSGPAADEKVTQHNVRLKGYKRPITAGAIRCEHVHVVHHSGMIKLTNEEIGGRVVLHVTQRVGQERCEPEWRDHGHAQTTRDRPTTKTSVEPSGISSASVD